MDPLIDLRRPITFSLTFPPDTGSPKSSTLRSPTPTIYTTFAGTDKFPNGIDA